MRFAARTHPGQRGANEDAIGFDQAGAFCFVADGMGGHASGDVASRLVKEALLATLPSVPAVEAVRRAHAAVVTAAEANSAHGGMGSTVVVASISPGHAQVVWVGDSRAYLWRKGRLRQLTRDHSFLEILREQEGLSDAELRGHPHKNLVTQTLGIGEPTPASIDVPLRTGDWLVLCSDGLNDELDDAQIAAVLARHGFPDDAADALIEAAIANGGHDNVSVVLAEYDGPDGPAVPEESAAPAKPASSRSFWRRLTRRR
jgi:protein phosphatase